MGGSDFKVPTGHLSVFLENGQVFFGRLKDTGAYFLTLREVFYVRRVVSGEKKVARNILIRRGSELHAPDFMRINVWHVVFIEPVAPDFRVAQLILETQSLLAAAPEGARPPPAAPPKS